MKISELNFAALSKAIDKGDVLLQMDPTVASAAKVILKGNTSLLTSKVVQAAIAVQSRIQSTAPKISRLNFKKLSRAIVDGKVLAEIESSLVSAAKVIPDGNVSALNSKVIQAAIAIHSRMYYNARQKKA